MKYECCVNCINHDSIKCSYNDVCIDAIGYSIKPKDVVTGSFKVVNGKGDVLAHMSENKSVPDMVNHPEHYKSKNGLEVIDVIEAFTSDLSGIEATDTGNVIKYICRWKKKNGVEDLKKIRWYVNHLIKHLEKR